MISEAGLWSLVHVLCPHPAASAGSACAFKEPVGPASRRSGRGEADVATAFVFPFLSLSLPSSLACRPMLELPLWWSDKTEGCHNVLFNHGTIQITIHNLWYGYDTIMFPSATVWEEGRSGTARQAGTCDQEHHTATTTATTKQNWGSLKALLF